MKKYLFSTSMLILFMLFQHNMGAQSCTGSASMNVTISPALSVTGTVVNIGCGNSVGSITTNVSGSVAPYTYLWSNSATTANLVNLTAGTYTVTVTGANGCSKSQSFTVANTGGNLNISGVVTNAGCVNGSIAASASGGTAPYSYHWSNNQNTATATNLQAGTYTVTVTATGGCSGTKSFAVTSNIPTPVLATPTATCNSITMNWTGPNTGSYEVKYRSSIYASPIFASPSLTTYTFTGLLPSTRYKVYVRYKCPTGTRKSAWVAKTKVTPACLTQPENNVNSLVASMADPVLNIFPNPASDEVNISYQSDKTELASLYIINSLGQLVSTNTIPTQGETYKLNTSDLVPGFYWITVQQGEITKSTKLIISK